VPIAVAAVVAGLLAAWLLKRHKRRAAAGPSPPDKDSASVPVVKDLEMGTGPPSGGNRGSILPAPATAVRSIRRSSEDACRTSVDRYHGRTAAMPYSFGGSSQMLSTPSGITASSVDLDPVTGASSLMSSLPSQSVSGVAHQLAPGHSAVTAAAAAGEVATAAGTAGAGGSTIGSRARAGWQQARRNSRLLTQPADLQRLQELQASMQEDTAHFHDQHQHQQLPGAASTSAGITPVPSTGITPVPSTGDGRQDSTSTLEPGTPKSSLEMHAAAFQGPASSYTGGSSGTGSAAGDRRSSMAALLKARSDVAVLRDLRIGTLLGRGSYGRVYRGKLHLKHTGQQRQREQPSAGKHALTAGQAPGQQHAGCNSEYCFLRSMLLFRMCSCKTPRTRTLSPGWLEGDK
jgi:hypothetical protein